MNFESSIWNMSILQNTLKHSRIKSKTETCLYIIYIFRSVLDRSKFKKTIKKTKKNLLQWKKFKKLHQKTRGHRTLWIRSKNKGYQLHKQLNSIGIHILNKVIFNKLFILHSIQFKINILMILVIGCFEH